MVPNTPGSPLRTLAVVAVAEHPTEGQTRSLELFAQADIKGDVAVVRVHVEVRVLAWLVLDHEAVVVVEAGAGQREQEPCDGLQDQCQQAVHRTFQANLVHNHTVPARATR